MVVTQQACAPKFIDCIGNNAFEDYFYIDGLTSACFGGRTYSVIQQAGKTIEIKKHTSTSTTLERAALSMLKMASYFTIIIPLIMLIGKINYRQSHNFVTKTPPQIHQVAPIRPTPQTIHKTKVQTTNTHALTPAERISIGTYNILFPQVLDPKTNKPGKYATKIGYSVRNGEVYENSAFRIGVIAKNILKSKLDVLCLQEVTEKTAQELTHALAKDYQVVYEQHNKNNKRPNSHGVAVLYKKHKFTNLNKSHGTCTYPTNFNNKPGTQTRSHLIMDLQDKTTQKVFRVASIHTTDPRELRQDQKTLHTYKVLKDVESLKAPYKVDRIIIAGDMNQDQFGDIGKAKPANPSARHASAFKPFFKKNYFVDANLEGTEFSKNDFDNSPVFCKRRRIDWIFVRDHEPDYLELKEFDNRGSDHKLTAVTVN